MDRRASTQWELLSEVVGYDYVRWHLYTDNQRDIIAVILGAYSRIPCFLALEKKTTNNGNW